MATSIRFDPAVSSSQRQFVPGLIEKFTVVDYCSLSAGPENYQLVEGELIVSPSPTWQHQQILRRIFRMLDAHVVCHALGDIATAPIDVYLSEHDVFQPDLLFVANDRSGIVHEDGVHGAPDLVVEILSAGTAHLDKNRKRIAYAANGVRELWLIDPTLFQVHAHEFSKSPSHAVRILEDNQILESGILPGFSIRIKQIFQE